MLKLLFDQNFNRRILRGLVQRISELDYETTQSLKKQNETDSELLALASEMRRVIVTHDFKTFPAFAYEKTVKGENMFGVIWVLPADMPIGEAVRELEILIICSDENEFENRVEYLPLNLT